MHERELENVPDQPRQEIRRLQRAYAEEWVQVLIGARPGTVKSRLAAS